MVGRRRPLVLALLAVFSCALLGAAPASAKKHHVLHSPGYKGTTKVPKTKPAPTQAPQPPVVLAQDGSNPQVVVDAAGTAHIVWTEEPPSGPDITRYCRLKRGSTTCDNPPSTQRLPPPDQPGSNPEYNIEYGLRVLAVGDELAIVSYRFPNVTQKPNGDASSNSTYLYLSSDGGNSFSPPALVGDQDPSGDAVAFGPPDGLRIGLISDTQTGGTFFQSIVPGRYSGAHANLDEGDGNRAYSGSLAAVGSGLVAAFADSGGHTYVRQWTGPGDPNDAGTWTPSPPPFPDSEPHVASGPAGSFVLSRQGLLGDFFEVRRLNGTQAGSPTRVTDTSGAVYPDFFEDPGGHLHVVWFNGGGSAEVALRTSTDGTHWDPDQILDSKLTDARQLDVSAAADGGGFATFVDDSGARRRSAGNAVNHGRIVAVGYGNQAATGKPGLGSLEGGSGAPGVTTSCQQIAFGNINVHATEGCLLGAVGRPGTKVSEGTLDLNGIQIVPDAGVKIVVDGKNHTIDSSGTVSVQLVAPGIPSIELFHGELHLKLDGLPGSDDPRCSPGQKLISFSAGSGTNLEDFPIEGSIDIYLTPQGACIPISLQFPAAFGGIRGDAVLKSESGRGLHIDSLDIEVKAADIGPLSIGDLAIKYDGPTDSWSGAATLGLPGGAKLGVGVSFVKGDFNEGHFTFSPFFPGITLDPFAASYLHEIHGGFALEPPKIEVGAQIGVIPIAPPSTYTVDVDGTLTVTFSDPLRFDLDGTGKILELPVGHEHLTVNTDGYARAMESVDIGPGEDVFVVEGSIDVFIDLPSRQFSGGLVGKACALGICGGQELVISSKGFGICLSAGIKAGFGYTWGSPPTSFDISRLDVMGPFSCDLSDYVISPPPGGRRGPPGRAAQAGARTVTVAPGATSIELRLDGAGGSPSVALVDPSGARIVPSTDVKTPGAPAYAIALSGAKRTFVAIDKPKAGTWQIVPQPGSPALTGVAQAVAVPAPQVSGRVSGHGHTRVLKYAATTGNGLQTTFFEESAAGRHMIGRARKAHGSIRFHPGLGPKGRRTIQALVERNGVPRLNQKIATYVAPPQKKPARVRHVRVARTKTAAIVHWHKVNGAKAYLVRIDVSDGRRELRIVSGKKSSVRLPAVPRRFHVKVRVKAQDATGHSGPSGSARG